MFSLGKFSPRTFDWWLCGAVALLVALGLTSMYSVDLSRGAGLVFFKKQFFSVAAGFALFFGASLTQYTVWRFAAKWWYAASIILLIAVLIIGRTIRGTTGWFVIGDFTFQPVEFAKLGLIFMLAFVISRFGREFSRPLFFFGTGILTLIIFILTMMQPDLGSAMLFIIIWYALMWLVKIRRLYLLAIIVVAVAGVVMAWMFLLQGYQRDRIYTFFNPARDPLGSGYNVTQSIIAVGAGKMFGRGLGFGSQSQLKFLPEAQTDFIFSVIAEELGFAGVLLLLALFAALFWRLLTHLRNVEDDFNAIVISGVIILLFSQFFINIGASIGILPITGLPLPFVSYGGSSLLTSLLMIGVVESMVARRY